MISCQQPPACAPTPTACTKLRDEFFQKGEELDAADDPAATCWRDGGRIDYAAPNSTPDSHNLGHYRSVRDHPGLQEDPDNFRHEQALCN